MKTSNKWLIVLAVLAICFFVAGILSVINSGIYDFNSEKVNCIGVHEIENFFVKTLGAEDVNFNCSEDFFINERIESESFDGAFERNLETKAANLETKINDFENKVEASAE